jgi:hypothetical protein
MKTPDYELFTAEGNALVNGVVQAAKVSGMQWDRVYSMLEKISEIDGFREATDTAVRDSVWVALTMADYERRVENI